MWYSVFTSTSNPKINFNSLNHSSKIIELCIIFHLQQAQILSSPNNWVQNILLPNKSQGQIKLFWHLYISSH